MKLNILHLFLFFILLSCSQEKASLKNNSVKKIERKDIHAILDSSNITGTVLVFDAQQITYYSNSFDEAKKSVLPASTYKIANSIIGLETKILEDEKTIFKWDGRKRSYSIWEKDLSLKEAFQKSCVPCYQELATKIGVERMNMSLNKLKYGEMDVTDETLDNFWLIGKSKISPYLQIDFLKRFYNQELPISKTTYETVKNILILEENDNYTLSGKTGLATSPEVNIGWFVGYVEKKKDIFYFATRISPKGNEMPISNFSRLRKEITITALKELNILD